MKSCIVHIPNKLNSNMASASQIRPLKMIEAFKSIGYEVNIVEGNSSERKKEIKQIKRNIKMGKQYEFMYAESSTMPTLLTDKHHLPLHPFMDFSFFRFVRKHNIKIGLFYRDIYWKFPSYKENVKGIKAWFAIKMYKYDLKEYSKYLNKLYMPNERCFKHINKEIPKDMFDVLPPGCVSIEHSMENKNDITILYVGGLGNQYQITKAIEVIAEFPSIHLILCCRLKEWEKEKEKLLPLMNDNIEVVHESGDGLEKLYKRANIGLLLFKPDIYREMAMPYKAFEYMGHGLPMIASKQTAIGDFVEKGKFGWTIPYDNDSLKNLLLYLINNKNCIDEAANNSRIGSLSNGWDDRALKVEKDLT